MPRAKKPPPPEKRPPGRPSQGKTARMQLVLTPEQLAKARQRGGSPWVASLIDAA